MLEIEVEVIAGMKLICAEKCALALNSTELISNNLLIN